MRHLCVTFLFFCFLPLTAHTERLPLEAFASLPDVQHMSLSPNGRHLASTVRVELEEMSGRSVNIVDLESGERTFPLSAKNEKYVITWMHWANNEHLLVGAMYPEARVNSQAGFKFSSRETTLMVVNVKTGKVQTALSGRFLSQFDVPPFRKDHVIDMLPEDKAHILMQMTGHVSGIIGTHRSIEPLIYKVNLNNRNVTRFHPPEKGVCHWMTDRQHRVRLSQTCDETQFGVRVRDNEQEDWRTLWQYQAFSEDTVRPLGFGKDPNILYISAYHEGLRAVFKVDLSEEPVSRELVYADPENDVNGRLLYSSKTGEVIGVSHVNGQGFTFWKDEYKNFQAAINNALPNTTNYIIDFSEDEQKYLVLASSDTDSGTYFLGDREAGTLDAIAYRYQQLPPEKMQPQKTYNYKARDGLEIEAFLTLPEDYAGEPVPAVVFPHGGPIAQTTRGFNYWTQLMANRGYAVLQMNFRGSSGKGVAFMQAGLKNWGEEMQDDVQDGALKMIEDGIADPEKICIVGGSYGGYAALMGAAKTPDFYRCAFSFAGVSDVPALVRRYSSRYSKTDIVDLQIGDDREQLSAISPVNLASDITIPVMLVHGAQDEQVRVSQSQDMAEALERAEASFEYIELEGANHYLSHNDDRLATLGALERFLEQHLGKGTALAEQ
ncbi:alpha/beta hydrolase family protein [Marinimicrobium agarilyticum]|uniref:alpha/beta hydrolase family protein n=1 Tax=Marinimicrobium agarilyticum TaxID=306546 RepID=UPI0004252377|nr:prolyl oligopeptidase family serine peptidase [Marinimicrobium agarilyticum]